MVEDTTAEAAVGSRRATQPNEVLPEHQPKSGQSERPSRTSNTELMQRWGGFRTATPAPEIAGTDHLKIPPNFVPIGMAIKDPQPSRWVCAVICQGLFQRASQCIQFAPVPFSSVWDPLDDIPDHVWREEKEFNSLEELLGEVDIHAGYLSSTYEGLQDKIWNRFVKEEPDRAAACGWANPRDIRAYPSLAGIKQMFSDSPEALYGTRLLLSTIQRNTAIPSMLNMLHDYYGPVKELRQTFKKLFAAIAGTDERQVLVAYSRLSEVADGVEAQLAKFVINFLDERARGSGLTELARYKEVEKLYDTVLKRSLQQAQGIDFTSYERFLQDVDMLQHEDQIRAIEQLVNREDVDDPVDMVSRFRDVFKSHHGESYEEAHKRSYDVIVARIDELETTPRFRLYHAMVTSSVALGGDDIDGRIAEVVGGQDDREKADLLGRVKCHFAGRDLDPQLKRLIMESLDRAIFNCSKEVEANISDEALVRPGKRRKPNGHTVDRIDSIGVDDGKKSEGYVDEPVT